MVGRHFPSPTPMDSSLHSGCFSSYFQPSCVFGRFQEQHYWDLWIVKGLLKSQLFSIANDTLQNFMDQIERFGFIPNGGCIYYWNHLQPPLFIQMLRKLANRTVSMKSPITKKMYMMTQYRVTNTAPRPESYLQPTLNASQSTALYAELASGTETDWDYALRWLTNPTIPNPMLIDAVEVRPALHVAFDS
ncbi:Six-hairpin glycosidase-like protein [Mycena epipterygia]|nr:Six-hairpin glycosidase-like protein [Mycena epipterygia]